jgi:hypothetical protein
VNGRTISICYLQRLWSTFGALSQCLLTESERKPQEVSIRKTNLRAQIVSESARNSNTSVNYYTNCSTIASHLLSLNYICSCHKSYVADKMLLNQHKDAEYIQNIQLVGFWNFSISSGVLGSGNKTFRERGEV